MIETNLTPMLTQIAIGLAVLFTVALVWLFWAASTAARRGR